MDFLRISPRRCRFADAATERRYRGESFPADRRLALVLFATIGAIAAAALVVDLVFIEDRFRLAIHVGLRSLVMVAAVAAIWACRHWPSPGTLSAIAFAFTLAPITMFLVGAGLRGGTQMLGPATAVAIAMGALLFIPTSLSGRGVLAGYVLGGAALQWGVLDPASTDPGELLRFIFVGVLALALGLAGARRMELVQRRRFAEVLAKDETRRRLEQEAAQRFRIAADLREAKERAEEAVRVKTEFLAVMSHEIRTPMNAILGLTRILLEDELTPRQRRLAASVDQAGRVLRSLLGDLLDLSRLESGRLALADQVFAPDQPIAGAIDLMMPQAAEKGLALGFRLDPALPAAVRGDPERMQQVLLNFLSNAVKFTDAGAIEVTVTVLAADAEGVELRLAVADTGIGVDPAAAAELFEPFVQGEGGLTRRRGGSGLGLAICKQIAELMGGAVGADGIPGRGATFWATLRLGAVDAGALPVVGPAAVAARPLAVVVIDDQPSNRLLLEEMLTGRGHQVRSFAAAAPALTALAAEAARPDVVLMDLEMPGMDGLAAIRAIRAAAAAAVPIVVVSGHVGERFAADSRAAGADAYLAKPVTPEALAAAFAELGLAAAAAPLDAAARQRLCELFAAAVLEQRPALTAALAAADGAALAAAAHALIGPAGIAGLGEVAAAARAAEEAAQGGGADLGATAHALLDLLDRIAHEVAT